MSQHVVQAVGVRPRPRPRRRGAAPPRPPTTRVGRPHTRTASASKGARSPIRTKSMVPSRSGCLATVSPCPRVTCATPTCTATRSSSSPRTTCGRRRSTAAGLPAHRRRRAGGPAPDLARTAPSWRGRPTRERAPEVFVTEVDGGGRAAAHLVGRPHHAADRLDARGRGAGGERGRAAVAAPSLGARHPGARRHSPAAAAGPAGRSGAARRRPGGAALGHHDPRDGVAEALPRRHRGQAVVEPGGHVRAARRRPRRPPRRADARSATGSRSSPTTRAGATSTRSTRTAATCAATPTTAATARPRSTPGTRPPTAPGSSTSRPGELWLLDDLDGEPRRLDVRLGGPRTAREPYRVTTGEWLGSRLPRTPPAGPASSASAAPCTGSPTATAPPARCTPPPACGPGSPRRWARTARCGSTTRSARTPSASPRSTRAPRTRRRAAVRPASSAGCWSWCPRPDGERVALTTHDGRLLLLDSPTGELRELARGGDGEIHDLAFSPDSAWLAYCDPVGSGLTPGRARAAGRRRGGRRSPRAASATPTRCSPSTASTWRSCPCAASTRSTTSTPSTSPSRRRWRPFLVPLGRAHPVAVRREPGRAPGLAGGRQAGGPARARPVRPRRRDRASAQPRRRRRRTRGRPRSSSTSRGSPPGWCRSRSSRAATAA